LVAPRGPEVVHFISDCRFQISDWKANLFEFRIAGVSDLNQSHHRGTEALRKSKSWEG
jgi:hypothetical protein